MRYHSTYRDEQLNRIAFPLGGIGAGMVSLEGTGALAQVSLRHKPDVNHEPQVFAALHVKGTKTARVLEGPVPPWKAFGSATGEPQSPDARAGRRADHRRWFGRWQPTALFGKC